MNDVGVLVVECRDAVTITLNEVTRDAAVKALDDLANRRTTTLEDHDGALFMVDPYSVVVARWEPTE